MTLEDITRAVTALPGISALNPIQRAVAQSKADSIILIAPTGSGKTIAFTIGLLLRAAEPNGATQALVLAPSRELVMQTAEVIRRVARQYKTVALYGGHSMTDETNSLRPLPDIIVATPGRMLDHLQRGNITLDSLRTLVIDEYDKQLELGFEQEMKRIIRRIGHIGDIILTSATELTDLPEYLPRRKSQLIRHATADTPQSRTATVRVESFVPDKLDTLCDLLRSLPEGSRTIVFVNHRESAERVKTRLDAEHIDAGLYHGALDQDSRATAIDLLTNGTTPVLVATDLAARGLDIEGIDNVVHYHIPVDEAAWTHRNGRTARVDATGTVYVITSEHDSVPEYIRFDRDFRPPVSDGSPRRSRVATLYFAAGKKEKISRGDIVGFLTNNSPLTAGEIGRIALHDHYALAAVPRAKVREVLDAIASARLKGKKIRVSQLRRQ